MGKPQGNHSYAKHNYEVGSSSERMDGIISNPNPHNQQLQVMGYTSGEILSPRSVLEQKALSGLAIAIALEESKKPWARPLLTAREDPEMEGLYTKEGVNSMINTKNEEGVGTKEVEVVDGLISTSNISASSSISSTVPVRNLVNCGSLPENRHNDWLNHDQHGLYEEPNFPSSNSLQGESIFYCANPSPPNSNYFTAANDNHTCFVHPTAMEDILKFCFFCKCHLGVGKDIYMYRGDRAFCSTECRYQHIVNDECKGASSSAT